MPNFPVYTHEDADRLNQELANRRGFKNDCRGCRVLRSLLVETRQFEAIRDNISDEHSELFESHQLMVDLITQLSVNTLEDIYVSLQNYQYTAAYRGFRYLYECHWILHGLNQNRKDSREIYEEYQVQLDALVGGRTEWPLFEYKHIHDLGRMKSSGRDRLPSGEEGGRDIYDILSDQGNHPLRLDKAHTQGTHHENLELDGASLSLWVLVGVISEYYLSFPEHQFPEYAFEALGELGQRIAEETPGEPPMFLAEYFDVFPTDRED